MIEKMEGLCVDVYVCIIDCIVVDFEKGVWFWIQLWSVGYVGWCIMWLLCYNGEFYSGMNVLLFWLEVFVWGFILLIWMMFKQVIEFDVYVCKGELGVIVIYVSWFIWIEIDGNGGEVECDILFLKIYLVFNVEQIVGLFDYFYWQLVLMIDLIQWIDYVDCFFVNIGLVIWYGGVWVFYVLLIDYIQMLLFELFCDVVLYVVVLSYEYVYWMVDLCCVGCDFSCYVKDCSECVCEEFVVEIGLVLMCVDFGIVFEFELRFDYVSYVELWLIL